MMLKNETEYRRAVEEVTEQRGRLQQQIERLRGERLSDEQVRVAMEPLWAYHRQLADEIERYERIKRGEFDVLRNLDRLGELLIAVRIYLSLTQAQLAERLGVDPSVVCRDERNEYHGVTLERAAKTLNAMRVELRTSVEVPGHGLATLPRETPGSHDAAATTRPQRIGMSQRWQAVAADSALGKSPASCPASVNSPTNGFEVAHVPRTRPRRACSVEAVMGGSRAQ